MRWLEVGELEKLMTTRAIGAGFGSVHFKSIVDSMILVVGLHPEVGTILVGWPGPEFWSGSSFWELAGKTDRPDQACEHGLELLPRGQWQYRTDWGASPDMGQTSS